MGVSCFSTPHIIISAEAAVPSQAETFEDEWLLKDCSRMCVCVAVCEHMCTWSQDQSQDHLSVLHILATSLIRMQFTTLRQVPCPLSFPFFLTSLCCMLSSRTTKKENPFIWCSPPSSFIKLCCVQLRA